MEVRRIDVFSDTLADIAARTAREADTFVAVRPNGAAQEPEDMIEGVLFGSGRHLLLVPDRKPARMAFDHILVAWNGSRESTRALAESMPYLDKAKSVAVVSVVDDEVEENALIGVEAVTHLKHHGVEATLLHPKKRKSDVSAALIAEARRQEADLIVMGGYGHSRLREWLLGGMTYELLHQAPVPLLIAH
jgi:nucleotide-binding universal stress UspA family protein